jgi:transcriptional regulator with XRE-family HTH domain
MATKSRIKSDFRERLEYARDRQRVLGTWDEDQAVAAHIGVSKSQYSAYTRSDTAPASERTLLLAQWLGVDPGWLMFGEESQAPAPDGFAAWLEKRRAPRLPLKGSKSAAARKQA